MASPLFGEFLGTAVLILLGNGVVANTLLSRSKGQGAGWVAITAGWGFAVMCGVFTASAFGSAAGHLNPAVTLAAAVRSGDYSRFAPFAAVQLGGAIVGAVLVWIYFTGHWEATEDADTKRGCFCTSPALRNPASNFLCEAIGTMVLVIVGTSLGSRAVSPNGPAAALGPYLVGALVWSIGLSLGGTTGYAINPVRDLGPRMAHALLPIAGKGGSDWAYAWVPIAGPLVGALLGGLLLRSAGV
jgi:glycerol uptake facilitator protein